MNQALKNTTSKNKSNKSTPTVEAEILYEKSMVCKLKNTSIIQVILISIFILFHQDNGQTTDKVLVEVIRENKKGNSTKTTKKTETNKNKSLEKKNAKFLVNIIFQCQKKFTLQLADVIINIVVQNMEYYLFQVKKKKVIMYLPNYRLTIVSFVKYFYVQSVIQLV